MQPPGKFGRMTYELDPSISTTGMRAPLYDRRRAARWTYRHLAGSWVASGPCSARTQRCCSRRIIKLVASHAKRSVPYDTCTNPNNQMAGQADGSFVPNEHSMGLCYTRWYFGLTTHSFSKAPTATHRATQWHRTLRHGLRNSNKLWHNAPIWSRVATHPIISKVLSAVLWHYNRSARVMVSIARHHESVRQDQV